MRPMSKLPDLQSEISNGRRVKKHRKRWCKGKVGVAHDPVWKELSEDWQQPSRNAELVSMIFECVKCHKRLDWWFHWWGFGAKYDRPDIGSREQRKAIMSEKLTSISDR